MSHPLSKGSMRTRVAIPILLIAAGALLFGCNRPPALLPATVSISGGDAQKASPGSALTQSPVVRVVDANGSPVRGVTVTFAVGLGGGGVEGNTAVTDSDGRATCGVWTLGPSAGVNTLVASASELPSITFVAFALRTASDIVFQSVFAGADGLWPRGSAGGLGVPPIPPRRLGADIASTYSLASVVATVQSTASPAQEILPLTYSAGIWATYPLLDAIPRGPSVLFVTATDSLGNVADDAVAFTIDRPPTVSVTSPLSASLARPTLHLTASCSDDDPKGCVSLTARTGDEVVASGQSALDQVLDLSRLEGNSVQLSVEATDSAGQPADAVVRTVFVESSSGLVLRASVGGEVWDVLGARVLFLDTAGSVPTLKVRDLDAGVEQVVESHPDLASPNPHDAFLTPWGALYVRAELSPTTYPYCWLYEWRDATLTQLTGLNSCWLKVEGDYALYSSDNGPAGVSSPVLTRRELDAGVSSQVATNAGNIEQDVAPNGVVAYWTNTDYAIERWDGGTPTLLTNDSSATTWNTYPRTDGTSVVYRKTPPCCSPPNRLAVHDGTSESILVQDQVGTLSPGINYAIAPGWIAYTQEDLAQATQVWRRGPSGDAQVSFFSTASVIEGLAPDGTVVFKTANERYISAPGDTPRRVGSDLGRLVHRDGAFFVLLGSSVLEVAP